MRWRNHGHGYIPGAITAGTSSSSCGDAQVIQVSALQKIRPQSCMAQKRNGEQWTNAIPTATKSLLVSIRNAQLHAHLTATISLTRTYVSKDTRDQGSKTMATNPMLATRSSRCTLLHTRTATPKYYMFRTCVGVIIKNILPAPQCRQRSCCNTQVDLYQQM